MSKRNDHGGAPYCGVPPHLAEAMTWTWADGGLEFKFRGAKDERAMLTELHEWLAADERNTRRLAEFMVAYSRSFDRGAA